MVLLHIYLSSLSFRYRILFQNHFDRLSIIPEKKNCTYSEGSLDREFVPV